MLVAAGIVWYGSVNFVIMLMDTLLAELDCKELHLSTQSINISVVVRIVHFVIQSFDLHDFTAHWRVFFIHLGVYSD